MTTIDKAGCCGSIPGPSRAQGAARAGAFASSALGAVALAAAAAFLLAPSPARAFDECGALNAGNSYTQTCANQAYATGISYRNIVANASLTVGGGTATTITSLTTGASFNNAISIANTAAATRRDISLTVGNAGAVVILQGSSAQANSAIRNQGIFVTQTGGGGSTMTVDVRSGVTIGTPTARMTNSGIFLRLAGANAPTGAGAMTLTSGATIYASTHGINLTNIGPGASMVTNSGAIDASNQGIHVEDTGSAGAVTVTNSGAITAAWQGIFAKVGGTGKDAAGTNAGVSVTHSAGAITSSGNRGIQVLVGDSRQESNTGHGSYVAPMNTGVAKVSVTGGSISAQQNAIEAINYEAGGIDIAIAAGVTMTSTAGNGIYAQLADVGNTAGTVSVNNAGEITAATTGILVRRSAPMGAGAITVDNDGDLKKTGSGAGQGIQVQDSGIGGVTVDNSGAIGEASATNQHQHGINVSHSSTGAGDVSVTNSGAIWASQSGIYLDNQGSGASTVTNSGAITASQRGIYVRERGSAGAVTVENSDAITATWTGILAQTTNKDAANTNAGISVTHSAGAISSTNNQGIQALVGENRSEGDSGGAGYQTPMNTGTAKVAVTGGSISSSLQAVEAINFEAGGVDIDVSSGVMLTSSTSSGIYAFLTDVGNTAGAIDVDNAGDITAAANGIFARQSAAANTGAISVTNEGAIEKTGAGIGNGILVEQSGSGGVTVMNSGAIGDATTRHERGIRVSHGANGGAGAGAVAVTNSGAVMAELDGVWVRTAGTSGAISVTTTGGSITSANSHGIHTEDNAGHTGSVTVANAGDVTAEEYGIWVEKAGTSGDISVTTTGGSITSATGHGIHTEDNAGHTGSVTVANAGDVTAERSGIYVARLGSGAVSVTSSGGTVMGETEPGILARNKLGDASDVTVTVSGGTVRANGRSSPAIHTHQSGTGDLTVTVSEGATLISKQNAGLFASLGNGDQVQVTQGGAVLGRTGVRVQVGASATADPAAPRAAQPVIDIDWSGTFAAGTTAQTAPDDNDRFVATTAAVAVGLAQTVVTEQTIRYGSPAGIEAQAMSWRDVMTEVAKGDDPDPFADLAAQQAAVPTGATASDNAYVEQFRAALGNGDIDVAAAVFDAIKTGATSLDDITDAEIVTYLHTNDDATRTLLRNILAESFTDEEKAVLRAVVTNTDLDAALEDADAAFPGDYKTAVRALLARYNVGNIDVTMSAGSIDSRGDGIRAYYATPNANNGAISVSVAAGATVTGAKAGIYVANAGLDAGEDADSTTDDILKQTVRVNGMVTGGTDAAVHLVGGGMLTVGETGQVLAGSSGRAILVNDPGRSEIVIHGTVRGGSGAVAAVETSGGGTITVKRTGRVVVASGATTAIKATQVGDDGPATQVVLEARRFDPRNDLPYRADVENRETAHIGGGITGTEPPTYVMVDDEGMVGPSKPVRLVNGSPDLAALNVCPEGQDRGNDGQCRTPPPPPPPSTDCPEGQVRGDDGQCRTPPPPPSTDCPEGQVRGNDGQCRTPTPTPPPSTDCPTGQVRGDDGQCRTPPRPSQRTMDNCDRASDGRCRLYEALPSVLLAMNGLPTHEERMAVVRDGRAGWARVEAARGKWKADSSTRPDVAHDYRRTGVQAGVDMAVGENGRLGVWGRALRGSADMTQNGGNVNVSGMGAGVSATTTAGGVYVDAQAAVSLYDVELISRTGRVLEDDTKATGYALAVEVGRPVEMTDSVSVTPRVGLAWSQVSLKDFRDSRGDPATPVSMKDADSVTGRVGVGVAKALDDGDGTDGSRLFGSLDVVQEFSEGTEVTVWEMPLEARAEKTRFRAAAGGAHVWDEGRYTLQGSMGFTAGGGDNRDFGGGLSFSMRF